MDGRTAFVALAMGLGAIAGLGGCAISGDLVETLGQVAARQGIFHHSQKLTAELFGLEESAFGRFKIYFQGPGDDPDIVVLDPLEDGYRFDNRGWQLAEGNEAVAIVVNALARTESAEALLGRDVLGRIVTLGIAVKERQKTSYKAGQPLYTISYNRFGLFRIGRGKFHEKSTTVDAEGSGEDG